MRATSSSGRLTVFALAVLLVLLLIGVTVPAEIAEASEQRSEDASHDRHRMGIRRTTPPQPHAANGCTWAEGNIGAQVCMDVTGVGLRVAHVSVSRRNLPSTFCGHKARVFGTLANGARYSRTSATTSGCSTSHGHHLIDVHRDFADGSQLCATWYEDGRWIQGIPCITVRR